MKLKNRFYSHVDLVCDSSQLYLPHCSDFIVGKKIENVKKRCEQIYMLFIQIEAVGIYFYQTKSTLTELIF